LAERRGRGGAVRADALQALVAARRRLVAVVDDRRDVSVAVADVLVAVAHRHVRHQGVGGDVGEATGSARADARLAGVGRQRAVGVGAAVGGPVALHAGGRGHIAVAARAVVLVAGRILCTRRIRRHARVAEVVRAAVAVDEDVGVVDRGDDAAGAVADVLLAVAGGLTRHRRAVLDVVGAALARPATRERLAVAVGAALALVEALQTGWGGRAALVASAGAFVGGVG